MNARHTEGPRLPRTLLLALLLCSPAFAAETPQILWTWTFTPPVTWDNVMCVRGFPDINGDGAPEALVASEDRFLRALDADEPTPPPAVWAYGGGLEVPVNEDAISFYPDRNGDGLPEILFTTGYADRSVYLMNSATGTYVWRVTMLDTGCTESAWMWDAVPIRDLNGDGVTDVVVALGARCSRVIALDGNNGAILWQYQALDGCRVVVDAGDLTGDGIHDVLAGSGANSADNKLFLLSGAPAAPARLVWQHAAGNYVDAATMVQDFTGDGVDDAIGGAWDRTVFAISGASAGTVPTPLWEIAVPGGTGWVQDTLRVPDLDGDCIDDVAVASWTPTTRIVSGKSGQTLWEKPVGTSTNAAYGALVPDVTGDLQWDYVAGSLNTGFVSLFSGSDGTLIWEWAAPRNVRSVAWIDDISGDGLPDILAGIQDDALAVALAGRTAAGCVRPAGEVRGVRASRLDTDRIQMTWDASLDACHGRYRMFGVPSDIRGELGCFARLVDITDQDEDGDPTNTTWSGPGAFFGYLVVDESAGGGKGPLGHFRR
jgi:hypothetical protein